MMIGSVQAYAVALLLALFVAPVHSAVMVQIGQFPTPVGAVAYLGQRASEVSPTPTLASVWRLRGSVISTPVPKGAGEIDTLWVSESESRWPYGGTVYKIAYTVGDGRAAPWSNPICVAAGVPQDYFHQLYGPWIEEPGAPLSRSGWKSSTPNKLRPDVREVVFVLGPAATWRLYPGPIMSFDGWLNSSQPGGGR